MLLAQEVAIVPTWLKDRWALKSLDVVERKKVLSLPEMQPWPSSHSCSLWLVINHMDLTNLPNKRLQNTSELSHDILE